jgi:hypothetical protein
MGLKHPSPHSNDELLKLKIHRRDAESAEAKSLMIKNSSLRSLRLCGEKGLFTVSSIVDESFKLCS